jgi:hypothetical protein
MPWHIEKHASGFFVIKSSTGEKKNNKPLTEKNAKQYLKALYANENKQVSQKK